MPGATFEPLDVVVVPFPFSDKSAVRRRPALVISGRAFNLAHDQLILAMITSAAQSAWPSDIALRDWRAAGLAVACRLRFKLFTLEKRLILRKVGALGEADGHAIRTAMGKTLALAEN
jgi:mRNA interferase MazF